MPLKLHTFPSDDGYRMPGEYEPHEGCLMIWPERPGSWIYGAKAAKKAFTKVASAIAKSEKIYLLSSKKCYSEATEYMHSEIAFAKQKGISLQKITILEMETNDAWARDIGPTFVKNEFDNIRAIDWQFNAWGGTYDGLYADWHADNMVASSFSDMLGITCYDASHFVLEGGSIHVDGDGTAMVTEACLLSPGRNPLLSKSEIETTLKRYLGVSKIIWLPHGIYQDETNEHIDNICAFVKPGEVLLAWCDDKSDPQYEYSKSCLDILEKTTDAHGRHLTIHKLPIPKNPILLTQEECDGFIFEEGEDMRTTGERLAASYINFYISNRSIIVPQFDDEHDALAIKILAKVFPDREIIPIYARDIIVGGGNIHCITQQIPKFETK